MTTATASDVPNNEAGLTEEVEFQTDVSLFA
jgi:hypothetical protein